jgi:hypothetical protein
MINGKCPVLIFNFGTKILPESLFGVEDTKNKTISKAQSESASSYKPVPIPILLLNSDELTNYKASITMTTRSENVGDKVFQRGMGVEVKKKITVKNDSIFKQMFLPLIMKAAEYIKGEAYTVSFFEDEITVFDGKISSMSSASKSDDDTLTDIEFTIVDAGSINDKEKKDTTIKAFGTKTDLNIPE